MSKTLVYSGTVVYHLKTFLNQPFIFCFMYYILFLEVAVLFGILTVSLQYFVPILVIVFTYTGKEMFIIYVIRGAKT